MTTCNWSCGSAACGLMILLGLSVPHFKRAYYILPMVPMFAAVAAYGLLHAQNWFVGLRRCYTWLVAALPALCVVVVFVCRHGWQKHVGYWPDVSLPLLIGVLVILQGAGIDRLASRRGVWCGSARSHWRRSGCCW
jgi:4-amino-4-deoxy-L-arabinose transferase-like glycosyltransferase